ncbi:MAG: hypothetical protein ACJA2S_001491 [Cyclobacteriaceae bacterium]|jgi:hypothetical protein
MAMKDNLEKFFSENKNEFDSLEPKNALWSKIESNLEEREKSYDYSWAWKVAAVLFLISTLVLLFRNDKLEVEQVEEEVSSNEGYNSQLIEVEGYYTKMISTKKKEIAKYNISNPELLVDSNLDSMYTDLKNNLKINQKDDRLINAMIRNLQLRVDILNRQLNILEQIKMIKEDEKVSV